MKRTVAALLAVLGCDPSPPPSSEPATAPPESAAPAVPEPTSEPGPPASLCVRMCALQGQAQAVDAESIRAGCDRRCASPPSPECVAFGAAARSRVEAVPMRERAAKVWAELSRPEFYCGYADPLTRGLSAAATEDLAARSTALRDAAALDPFRADTCPRGGDLDADATATDAIEACGLEDPAAGWQDDVDASSYLAARAVRLRLAALRLDDGDREIMLDTLVLATALAREK